jgi:hypothetical protein
MNQLFTVTLTDLGTYTLTVAAETPADAESIAKDVLFEEATTLPPGMEIRKREADAKAEPAAEPPLRQYRVTGAYTLDLLFTVPAGSPAEAERHAKRLYDAEPFPWDHSTGEPQLRWYPAREVVS